MFSSFKPNLELWSWMFEKAFRKKETLFWATILHIMNTPIDHSVRESEGVTSVSRTVFLSRDFHSRGDQGAWASIRTLDISLALLSSSNPNLCYWYHILKLKLLSHSIYFHFTSSMKLWIRSPLHRCRHYSTLVFDWLTFELDIIDWEGVCYCPCHSLVMRLQCLPLTPAWAPGHQLTLLTRNPRLHCLQVSLAEVAIVLGKWQV